VQPTADGLRHSQLRRDAQGAVVTEVNHTPVTVVGSGHHGQSFWVSRDQYLFMSPITWYPERNRWDLSPGYERRDSEFFRPVVAECLFCHANRVDAVPGSMNRVADLEPAVEAIGCQRCHGPGAEHVAARREGPLEKTPDRTIVNPGRLEPKLREAVCQQCHVSGLVRLVSYGRQWSHYRPGEPLEATLVAYARQSPRPGDAQNDETRFVGHAEQVLTSRCYVASDGRLGCISCHDPHAVPEESERIDFFRARCSACHAAAQQTDCGLSAEDARRLANQDNCLECHMPRQANQVRHTAITDHRILRNPGAPVEPADPHEDPARSRPDLSSSAAEPLRAVLIGTDQRPASQQQRDLAVALVMARGEQPEAVGREWLPRAAAWLEDAVRRHPDDVDALLAAGQIQLELDNLSEALAMFRRAVAADSQSELSWVWGARTLSATGQLAAAAANWRRATELNPYMANYWYELGLTEARLGRFESCRQLLAVAIERFPTSMGARQLLIETQLQLGNRSAAAEAFDFMRRFRPGGFERVEQWYGQRTQGR
jgi:tetratricopeptide (TPR) repeat protein